jgi:hypothetical protein
MNVPGEATFEIEGGALIIVATLKGLELCSRTRSCSAPAIAPTRERVRFPSIQRRPMVRAGAEIKHGFDGAALIPLGWSYMALHELHAQSQIDAAPVSCGDVAALDGQ